MKLRKGKTIELFIENHIKGVVKMTLWSTHTRVIYAY